MTGIGIPLHTQEGTSPWARETLRSIHEGIQDGSIERCPHVSDHPRIVHALDLTYRRSACPACIPEMFRDLSDAPATCDRCRRSGVDLYDSQAFVWTTTLRYTLCGACADLEDTEMTQKSPRSMTARHN